MKTCLLFAIMMISSNLAHAWDAVGVFFRPEKVIVQINEPYPAERLEHLLSLSDDSQSWSYLSEDSSFKAQCARGSLGITCVFRFLPTDDLLFSNKRAEAALPLSLGDSLELDFLNSNGDHFHIFSDSESVRFTAGKK